MRSDDQLKADDAVVALLAAVALGRIPRGPSISEPWILDGESVVLELRWLKKDDLIDMPISGPARLAPRGERLLSELIAEYRAEAGPD